jgi:hypothetical protein
MKMVFLLQGFAMSFFVLFLFIQGHVGFAFQAMLLVLFSFFMALSGLIIIIKREVNYTIISLHGIPAVLIGIMFLLAGLIFATELIIGIIRILT